MSKKPIITAAEAASWVKDGDFITTSGFVASGMPEAITKALEQRFRRPGLPRLQQDHTRRIASKGRFCKGIRHIELHPSPPLAVPAVSRR